jgi:subtilisin family serine protease
VLRRSGTDVAAVAAAVVAIVLAWAPSAGAAAIPNDPWFPVQWADENTGQPVPELGPGTPFADDSADEAWSRTTGSESIVIAETDTGVEYTHPDLAANMWTNPGFKGSCPAGTHGFDLLPSVPPERCEPRDEDTEFNGHGTQVAGIMGAVGNNGIGVAGMNWHTSILPVKWIDQANPKPEGSSRKLAEALDLVVTLKEEGVPVRIVNDSDTVAGAENAPQLEQAISALGAHGILFVTAAGNGIVGGGLNDDVAPRYPCSYNLPNEICVAATDNRDELTEWSHFGPSTVALAAPGAEIYSTRRNGIYGYISGTSMAAAQVSGAAALILSAAPWLTVAELKADILGHVDKLPSLQGKVATGGRLDVCEAMPGCVDLGDSPITPAAPAPSPPPPPAQAVIGSLKITPTSFKSARSGPAIWPRLRYAGTTVAYTDSQAASTEFRVLAPRPGVQNAARECVAPPRHAHGKPKRCVRWLATARFKHFDNAGRNSFRFSGHVARLALTPGHYRLLAMPTFAGRAGVEALAGFRIVP